MNPTQLVLLSGLSGAGKSVALKALEDLGYFAIDNLPAKMIPALFDSADSYGEHLAISIDARAGETLSALPTILKDLTHRGINCRVLFLEADNDTLSRRFAESRRPHPLADRVTGGVQACISAERRMLADIAELGHHIDTSNVNANTLRGWVRDWLDIDRGKITLTFQSFGFKHGIPLDANMVFDARFLPNPFYDPALRPLSGRDAPVKAFLSADPQVADFIADITWFVSRSLPSFARENHPSLTIAVGCTGGQHRSVFIVESLAAYFGKQQQVLVRHRDVSGERPG